MLSVRRGGGFVILREKLLMTVNLIERGSQSGESRLWITPRMTMATVEHAAKNGELNVLKTGLKPVVANRHRS
jgi:hypothetical protein